MFKHEISFGPLAISADAPVFLIAEGGVNHNGDLETAFRLIAEAKKAGAHAVKFQSFTADALVSKGTPKVRHHVDPLHPEETHHDMIKRLEIDEDFQRQLFARCVEEGILFLSTPYDVESARFLDQLGVAAFKTASADIVDLPLHECIAQTKKLAFVSVGMASMEEIAEVVDIYQRVGNPYLILLHCTSSYPASAPSLNLRVIPTLHERFGTLVGYSDHSIGNLAAGVSVALGACVIEKHFTLDRQMEGPDHKASIEPAEFAELSRVLQQTRLVLGDGIKMTMPEEIDMKQFSRKSLVSMRPISVGEVLGEKDVVLKRPGTGVAWKDRHTIIGKIAIHAIPADTVIDIKDFISS